MIRDNFDVAVATDIIGKSRKIKAILTEKKEAYLLVTILQKSAFLHF